MAGSIDSPRSDAVHFCKCGRHTKYHCKIIGENHEYCIKKQTVKVFTGNGKKDLFELFGKFNYLEYLNFRLRLIQGDFDKTFWIENSYGGKDILDGNGSPEHGDYPFQVETYLLRQIIKAQIRKRKTTLKDV